MSLRIALQLANPVARGKGKLFTRATFWIAKILYILLSLGFGVALICLPWFYFWENNYLLYMYPQLRPLVSDSYFKGAVLGLGIVDILIGIREIAHLKGISKGHPQ
jgi:hypothetical protein